MTPEEINQLLHWMPIVVRMSGLTDWERDFCASMIARGRARRLRPSRRQIAVMKRLVDRARREGLAADPPALL